MKEPYKFILFWSPRIISILFAVFISLFALDVFSEGRGALETIGALLIHLIPTAVILIVLAIAWRRDWLGASAFVLLGVLYLLLSWGRFHWSAYVIISGPLFLIGTLFLINCFYRTEIRAAP